MTNLGVRREALAVTGLQGIFAMLSLVMESVQVGAFVIKEETHLRWFNFPTVLVVSGAISQRTVFFQFSCSLCLLRARVFWGGRFHGRVMASHYVKLNIAR